MQTFITNIDKKHILNENAHSLTRAHPALSHGEYKLIQWQLQRASGINESNDIETFAPPQILATYSTYDNDLIIFTTNYYRQRLLNKRPFWEQFAREKV